MRIDQSALSDRLYADALSMCLRLPQRFYQHRSSHSWKDLEMFLRERASIYIKDLSVTAAAIECALEDVKAQWEEENVVHDKPIRDIKVLQEAASRLLGLNGREMLLRPERDEPGREILRWRFISLLIPPMILIAAATRDRFPVPKKVRILDPSMGPDFPVAHNHLHHAAITSFEELWVSFRRRLFFQEKKSKKEKNFREDIQGEKIFCPQLHPRECHGGKSATEKKRGAIFKAARARHMAEWADLILQAFIARRVLESHSWHDEHLAECTHPVCEEGRARLRAFLQGRIKPYSLTPTAYPWKDELHGLARRYRNSIFDSLRERKSELRSSFIRIEAANERKLLARAFARLDFLEDEQYEILFLQYLRVKTAVFKLLVHPPGEHGLKKFLEYFSQIKAYAGETDHLTPPKPDEAGLNLQATEYRVAPDAWLTKLRFNPWSKKKQATALNLSQHGWFTSSEPKPTVDYHYSGVLFGSWKQKLGRSPL